MASDGAVAQRLVGAASHAVRAAIILSDLVLGYRHQTLCRLTGTFEAGVTTALMGPNGAGKSTVLKSLLGLVKPLSGTIRFVQHSVDEVAYLAQAASIDRDFPISLWELVLLGAWPSAGCFRELSTAVYDRLRAALTEVELESIVEESIGNLSSGQFQRALFARLLLRNAPCILLDEPFSAVDQRTSEILARILLRWQQEKRTVIMVLHDTAQARAHCRDALTISNGRARWGWATPS